MIKLKKKINIRNVSMMLASLAVSAGMLISSFACGNMAYGAKAYYIIPVVVLAFAF